MKIKQNKKDKKSKPIKVTHCLKFDEKLIKTHSVKVNINISSNKK